IASAAIPAIEVLQMRGPEKKERPRHRLDRPIPCNACRQSDLPRLPGKFRYPVAPMPYPASVQKNASYRERRPARSPAIIRGTGQLTRSGSPHRLVAEPGPLGAEPLLGRLALGGASRVISGFACLGGSVLVAETMRRPLLTLAIVLALGLG